MNDFFLVVRFNVNKTTGAEQHSTQRYEDEVQARKRFYNILAADIDTDVYEYEFVQIVRSDGAVIANQVFDFREVVEEAE